MTWHCPLTLCCSICWLYHNGMDHGLTACNMSPSHPMIELQISFNFSPRVSPGLLLCFACVCLCLACVCLCLAACQSHGIMVNKCLSAGGLTGFLLQDFHPFLRRHSRGKVEFRSSTQAYLGLSETAASDDPADLSRAVPLLMQWLYDWSMLLFPFVLCICVWLLLRKIQV